LTAGTAKFKYFPAIGTINTLPYSPGRRQQRQQFQRAALTVTGSIRPRPAMRRPVTLAVRSDGDGRGLCESSAGDGSTVSFQDTRMATSFWERSLRSKPMRKTSTPAAGSPFSRQPTSSRRLCRLQRRMEYLTWRYELEENAIAVFWAGERHITQAINFSMGARLV